MGGLLRQVCPNVIFGTDQPARRRGPRVGGGAGEDSPMLAYSHAPRT